MAMAIAWRSRESCDDDVRSKRAHHCHHVIEHRVLRPVLSRLVRSFRESEIVLAPEILVRAIDPARGKQLLGPNHTQRFSELVADQILAAIAACQRHIRRLDTAPARQPGNDVGVLVVGMCRDP